MSPERVKDCVDTMRAIPGLISEIKPSNETVVTEMKDRCRNLLNCNKEANPTPEMIRAMNFLIKSCDSVLFLATDFQSCDKKMIENDAPCLESSMEMDDGKRKNQMENGCWNYYGKDGCLKTGIVGNCGTEMWDKFSTSALTINGLLPSCNGTVVESPIILE